MINLHIGRQIVIGDSVGDPPSSVLDRAPVLPGHRELVPDCFKLHPFSSPRPQDRDRRTHDWIADKFPMVVIPM